MLPELIILKKYDTNRLRLITLSHFRSFHPDFLLVRQNVKDASEDYRNLLLGFQYGGIPSINSLQSIYNFQVGTIILKVYSNSRNKSIYCIYVQINMTHMYSGQAMGVWSHDPSTTKTGQRYVSACQSKLLPKSLRIGT